MKNTKTIRLARDNAGDDVLKIRQFKGLTNYVYAYKLVGISECRR